MSQDTGGALPTQSAGDTSGAIQIQHGKRIDNLETLAVGLRASQ